MPGRQFPGLTRAAAEIELWKRLLPWPRPDVRARDRVELALEVDRPPRGPERLEDRNLLLHQRVALFLAVAHTLAFDLAFVLARDQVDADAPARHLVESRNHLRQQHRIDVAGPRRDQRLDLRRTRRHERAGDPGLPANRTHGNQEIFEARFFSGLHHAVT